MLNDVANNVTREILSAEVLRNLDKPIAEARGLPGKAFTSREFWELEKKSLFPNAWIAVAFAHQIPGKGDVLPLDVFDLPVVLVRGKDLKVRAFHNVCRHRGTKVVLSPGKGLSMMKCLYHCWLYDLEGKLRGTPRWDGTKNPRPAAINRAEHGLVPIKCAVLWDTVYINLNGNAADFAQSFDFLMKRYDGCHYEDLVPVNIAAWDLKANWKLGIEGVIEGYHEPFVHPQLPSRIGEKKHPLFEAIEAGSVFGSIIPADSEYDLKSIGSNSFPLIPGPRGGRVGLDIFVVYPTGTVVVGPDHLLSWIWTPLSVDRTRVTISLSLSKQAMGEADFERKREHLLTFYNEIMAQDGAALEAQQLARVSPVGDDILFSPFWEGRVQYFEQKVAHDLVASLSQ